MVNKTETPLYDANEVFYGQSNPGGQYGTTEKLGSGDPGSWNSNPNQQLGFEVDVIGADYSFAPEYYPEDFTAMKKKDLDRYGGNCGGETVSIKAVKNREFHARGKMTTNGLAIFNHLMEHTEKIDLISPILPGGGIECYVKKAEIGNQAGVDPLTKQRLFEYTLDFVSTGRDEAFSGENGIVTKISGENLETSTENDGPSISGDPAREITVDEIFERAGLLEEFVDGQIRAARSTATQPYRLSVTSEEELSRAVLNMSDEEAGQIIEAATELRDEVREGTEYPLENQAA